jgi:hypothetical protein
MVRGKIGLWQAPTCGGNGMRRLSLSGALVVLVRRIVVVHGLGGRCATDRAADEVRTLGVDDLDDLVELAGGRAARRRRDKLLWIGRAVAVVLRCVLVDDLLGWLEVAIVRLIRFGSMVWSSVVVLWRRTLVSRLVSDLSRCRTCRYRFFGVVVDILSNSRTSFLRVLFASMSGILYSR